MLPRADAAAAARGARCRHAAASMSFQLILSLSLFSLFFIRVFISLPLRAPDFLHSYATFAAFRHAF